MQRRNQSMLKLSSAQTIRFIAFSLQLIIYDVFITSKTISIRQVNITARRNSNFDFTNVTCDCGGGSGFLVQLWNRHTC